MEYSSPSSVISQNLPWKDLIHGRYSVQGLQGRVLVPGGHRGVELVQRVLEQPGQVVGEEVAVDVGAGGVAGEGPVAVRAGGVDVVDVGDDVLAHAQGAEVAGRTRGWRWQ